MASTCVEDKASHYHNLLFLDFVHHLIFKARRFGSREAPTLVDPLDQAILSLDLVRSKDYTSAGVFFLL